MGTHPIFESDFDCLTEMIRFGRRHFRLLPLSLPPSATAKLEKNVEKQLDLDKSYKMIQMYSNLKG